MPVLRGAWIDGERLADRACCIVVARVVIDAIGGHSLVRGGEGRGPRRGIRLRGGRLRLCHLALRTGNGRGGMPSARGGLPRGRPPRGRSVLPLLPPLGLGSCKLRHPN